MGDLAQQRQRRTHAVLFRFLQQLHANVVHHLVSKVAIAKAPTQGVDQVVVVTNQRGNQGWLGRVERQGSLLQGQGLKAGEYK
ncbi:hypothetical protein D9M68_940530 [compost metagenome]